MDSPDFPMLGSGNFGTQFTHKFFEQEESVLWLSIVEMRRWSWKTIKRNVPFIFLKPMNKSSICFERTNTSRKEQKLFPESLKYVTDPLTVAGEANILVTNAGSVGRKLITSLQRLIGRLVCDSLLALTQRRLLTGIATYMLSKTSSSSNELERVFLVSYSLLD